MASINYQSLLTELLPYADKVAFLPLTDGEIDKLEGLAEHRFPAFYREYLRTFGLMQDFVFGLLERPSDFKDTRAYLPKADQLQYIVIGNNSGEDCWLLRIDADGVENQLYECQHWNENRIVPLDFSFAELLHASFQEVRDGYADRLFNHQKSWRAQISVKTTEEQKILIALQATLHAPWELKDTSPANATEFRSEISLPDGIHPFSRLEYAGWETPIYFFNLQDAFTQLQAGNSIIKKTDRSLRNVFGSSYALIDYGLLPTDLPNEN
ncbi:hypothetical protein ACVWYF_000256 [Hymenobacter sp. UYAg731]